LTIHIPTIYCNSVPRYNASFPHQAKSKTIRIHEQSFLTKQFVRCIKHLPRRMIKITSSKHVFSCMLKQIRIDFFSKTQYVQIQALPILVLKRYYASIIMKRLNTAYDFLKSNNRSKRQKKIALYLNYDNAYAAFSSN
jgi:hypothetical protein